MRIPALPRRQERVQAWFHGAEMLGAREAILGEVDASASRAATQNHLVDGPGLLPSGNLADGPRLRRWLSAVALSLTAAHALVHGLLAGSDGSSPKMQALYVVKACRCLDVQRQVEHIAAG